jgi:hypothetical protein
MAADLVGIGLWRWFADRPLPKVDAMPLSAGDILALGELWQSAGEGPDKASGQWFTPPALIRRLLDQWAGEWLADQVPGLGWDGQTLVGTLHESEAVGLLRHWQELKVIDPAMGAGDWLCVWFQLHQAVGRSLARRCGQEPPSVAATLLGLHGIDRDGQAVALAEIRLGLLTGAVPPVEHLCVADSLVGDQEAWAGGHFDLVLGNPPYVSTRRLSASTDRHALQECFGYADDLYVHFIDRGLQALNPGGWLLFIVSDTFRTTITKTRLRRLLLAHRLQRLESLPGDAFSATVATVALMIRRLPPQSTLQVPPYGSVPLAELLLGPRQVLIDASPLSRERLRELRPHWEPLLETWADVLRNVRRQQEAVTAIERHWEGLRPGDWTLLGLLCDGGVGLQTGDNSAMLAVRADSEAGQHAWRRQAELLQAWRANPQLQAHLPAEAGFEVGLAALRRHFSAAALGLKRGEVWRIIDPVDVADPMVWPADWRWDGAPTGAVWVPYEKGDPDGRRWVHDNPFLIRWDRAAVAGLRASGRGRGEPVLRNPQFFFRPGVTWSNMSSHSLKARLQPPCVFDVGSMTLFPAVTWLDPLVLLAWLNAAPTTALLKAYVNHTLNFQINDLRLLPIPVPGEADAAALRELAGQAVQRGVGGATTDIEARISALVGACYGPAWCALGGAVGVS